MTTYWDFRRILDVDPDDDHTCVGIAKAYGHKCKHRVGVNYRSEGSLILDQMDHTENYSNAMTNLEDLAGLLLCKQVHNSQNKPHLNQINEVYRRWYAAAEKEHILMKRRAERLAVSSMRSDLSMMREAAQQLKDDLESAKEEMIAVKVTDIIDEVTPNIASTTTEAREAASDPFVVVRENDTTISSLSSAASLTPATQVNWPAVPRHQPSTKIPVFSDIQQYGDRLPIGPMESTVPATRQSISRNNRNTEAAFGFGNSKSDENAAIQSKSVQKVNNAEPSRIASVPVPRKRVALKKKSESMNSNIANRKTVPPESIFAFGATTSTPQFSFEVPKHPPACLVDTLPIQEASLEISSHIDQKIKDEVSWDFIPSHQSNSEILDRPCESSAPLESESFGYAVVTPPSTRYKTYLPARQQHGLMTPPDTPENLIGAHKSSSPLPPPKIGDYFANSSNPTSNAPIPKVTRKPVPVMQSLVVTEEVNEIREPREPISVDAGSNDKSAGCFAKFGFSGLRNKVAARLKDVKVNLSKPTR
ncbi:hypothetical protein BKA65DRAFT_502681 [Rhexocercosporidium sp. MPI-PUGE-AT-0058]|nr:hypothetical protein BKA65DRAFT_502681 [Rhexocercosporidium sp. MPI-PUGE-AT-0058]